MEAATTGTRSVARPREWRLGKSLRKSVLLVHVLAAGTWFGLDIAMGGLVFTALAADDQGTKAFAYRALEIVAVWPIITSGLVCLASGVLLGLGTSYGLTRFWWVAIKLVMNIVLSALTIFALRPGVQGLAAQAAAFDAGQVVTFVEDGIIFPPVVSSLALVIAFTLSVFKPFGRIAGRR